MARLSQHRSRTPELRTGGLGSPSRSPSRHSRRTLGWWQCEPDAPRRFRTVSPSRRSELHRQRTSAQPATRACSSPRDRLGCPRARDALSLVLSGLSWSRIVVVFAPLCLDRMPVLDAGAIAKGAFGLSSAKRSDLSLLCLNGRTYGAQCAQCAQCAQFKILHIVHIVHIWCTLCNVQCAAVAVATGDSCPAVEACRRHCSDQPAGTSAPSPDRLP
jgi:hypothetical protein